MHPFSRRLFMAMLFSAGMTLPAHAASDTPFIAHISTDDANRVSKAVAFSRGQFNRGHPLMVYLDDRGVFLGARMSANRYPEQQRILLELISRGVRVIICPYSMRIYGLTENDLLPGLTVGTPEMADDTLFNERARYLSW